MTGTDDYEVTVTVTVRVRTDGGAQRARDVAYNEVSGLLDDESAEAGPLRSVRLIEVCGDDEKLPVVQLNLTDEMRQRRDSLVIEAARAYAAEIISDHDQETFLLSQGYTLDQIRAEMNEPERGEGGA